jgi:hypothetical protein
VPRGGPKVRRSDDFHRRVPVPLGEHEIRVPANAEELLTQLYGPDWRRPDPGFTHKGPTRIIDERYRLSLAERTEIHWRRFYRDNQIEGSSTFARFVAERFPDAHTLVEFGCGTGRDSVFFAAHGFDVHASDRSPQALERAEEARRHAAVYSVGFPGLYASSPDQLRRFPATRRTAKAERPLVYLRFVLHAMPVEVEEVLLDTVSEVLEDGFSLCAEFRTLEDADRSKVFGDHQRRYIDDAAFADKLAARYGMRELLNSGSRRVETDLRDRLYRHLQRMSAAFYDRYPTGDVMARTTNDLLAVRMVAGPALMYLVDTSIRTLLIAPAMLTISPGIGESTTREVSVMTADQLIQDVLFDERADADVVADVAADAQAGLGAGDVEEARAVHVADAHIFHRLRFSDHDRIGRACAGNCDESRS